MEQGVQEGDRVAGGRMERGGEESGDEKSTAGLLLHTTPGGSRGEKLR